VAGGLDGTLWHRRGDVVEAALGAAGSTPAASADLARGAVRALVPFDGGLWALGTHDRVLGPFVGIPEDVRPEDGGLLGAQLSWTGGGLPPHYATVEVAGAIGPCTVCGLQVRIPWTPWLAILRGDLPRADFPAAALLAGSGLGGAGPHTARITRVRLEGDFDFDATAAAGLAGGVRRAWAWRSTSFLKL
jgi:hypothetical protein